jgi:adenylate cyclase
LLLDLRRAADFLDGLHHPDMQISSHKKGRFRFRSGFTLYYDPSLDDRLSTDGLQALTRRIRLWKRSRISLLVLAPDLKWTGSEELLNWHRICREEGMPVLMASVQSLGRSDFLYFRRLNQELHRYLTKGHVLFLYSKEASQIIRAFLPTICIHPFEISPDQAVEVVDGPQAPEEVRRLVHDYARSIHPYLPEQKKLPDSMPQSRFSIRRKLLAMIIGMVAVFTIVNITMMGNLFKKQITFLIQEYNQSMVRMIGDALDSDIDNLYASGNLLVSQKETPQSFFAKYGSAMMAASLRRDGRTGSVNIRSLHLNASLSADYGMTEAELISLLQSKISDELFNALPDIPVFSLLVREDGSRLLALSIWLDSEDSVQLIVLSPERLFERYESARPSGIFHLLLFDGQGRLVYAAEAEEWQGVDRVVQSMLESTVDSGSQILESEGKQYLASFRILRNGFGVISLVPSDRMFEAVLRLQRHNILIAIMILTVAFMAVYLFSRKLSQRFGELLYAMRRIEQGDFAVHIQPATRDEIGLFTEAFMQMVHGLRNRKNSGEEFPVYRKTFMQAGWHSAEKRICTILFMRIQGIMQLSESLQSEEIMQLLNRYFTAMVDCVTVTEGVVDTITGDTMFAHWGAFFPIEDQAKRAVQCALLMRKSWIDLKHSLARESLSSLHLGLGIHTGSVITGQFRKERNDEFTVIGEAVHLASLIEYFNEEFGTDILISDSTRRILGEDYLLAAMPVLNISGKDELRLTYAVLGRKDDPEAFRSLKQLRAELQIAFRSGLPEDFDES